MAAPSYHGRFVWHELFSNDSGSAAAFYSRVLGWQSRPFSPGSPYLLFLDRSGRTIAGAMALSDESRALGTTPHWRGYIGAGDVDAIVAHASRLGARILEPARDLPAVGRAAMLADPEGARFGVYKPLQEANAGAPGETGFAWCELAARSRETALAFYQQLFGWELRAPMDMGGGFHYQTFGLGGQDFGGAYTIPADRPMSPAWCPYASCASADEIAGKVIASGGQLSHGPVDVPGGGRIVQFFDPQHAMFAVHSMGVAAAKPAARHAAAASDAKAPARKPAKKPAKKPAVKKGASRPAKKAARRMAKKPARKSARRPAAKRAGKPIRVAKAKRGSKAKRAAKARRRPAAKSHRRAARKK
ncbi:MAG: VOC family protein [Gammaproteobacteria bacterium]|nr:VOC family protein [Gammaproteobacteria bacterium]